MTHKTTTSPGGNTVSKPYVIGITGGIASGKSAVGDILSELGVPVIDTDRLCHELLDSPNPAYDQVIARFGADLVETAGGKIDRTKLGERAFATDKDKCDLEAILQPAIIKLAEERIAALAAKDVVAVQVPLLFEAGLGNHYNETWCILVQHKTQVERLKTRNGVDEAKALFLIGKQWPQEKKAALSNRIIDNSGTIAETRKQVEKCLGEARAAAAKGQTPPAATGKSAEYKALLKKFGTMGVSECLGRMGDNLSTARHKDAEACVAMHVRSSENGQPDSDEHKLTVKVRMCVENKKGSESPVCKCAEKDGKCSCAACPCGTGTSADCGCAGKGGSCGGNTEPCPPRPPQPPTPPTPPRPPCHGGSRSSSGGLLAFLAFLAFLLVAGVLGAFLWLHPWDSGSSTTKPCPTPTCEKPGPFVVLTDEQFDKLFCKSKCQTPPSPPTTPTPPPMPTPPCVTCPPVDPPVIPPTNPGCAGDFRSPSSTPPSFILPYLHNQVRVRVSEWTVRERAGGNGAVVVGRDNQGRLVDWMEFGARCSFKLQWIVNYSNNGESVWVDLFHAPNTFVGRTVYEYSSSGRLANVTREDGYRRTLTTAVYERNPDGSLCKVVLRRFDPSTGRVVDVQVSWYYPNATLMAAEFYQFELYGQYR